MTARTGDAPVAAQVAAPSTTSVVTGPAHQHTWGSMRFELVDGRPFVRQACEACGAVRGYRAWDRAWTPGEAEVRR